ncbi:MAG: tetratricopeptide repeat protein, partial [Bacteroidetes bacterium]|nr:tetratricopeptide repeat protein [Bacteroidota bacterium]
EQAAMQYPPGGFVGEKEYEKAISKLKEMEPAYNDLDRGYRSLKEGHAAQALALAELGIQKAPYEAHLYNLKGKALWMQGDLSGALQSVDRAIQLNPRYFDFYLQRGLIRLKMGQYGAARMDLLTSQDLLPSAQGEYALGMIALHGGQRAQAVTHFKRAAQNPSATGRAAREQLRRLQKGR